MVRLGRPRVAVLVALALFGVAWVLGTGLLGLIVGGISAIAADDGARFGLFGATEPEQVLAAVALGGALLALVATAVSGMALALIRRAYRSLRRRAAVPAGPLPQESSGEWPY
jgi:hypothetical protein